MNMSRTIWLRVTSLGCFCALIMGSFACGGSHPASTSPAGESKSAPATGANVHVTLEAPLKEVPLGDGPIEVRLTPLDLRASWTRTAPAKFEVPEGAGPLTVSLDGDYLYDPSKLTIEAGGDYVAHVSVLPRVDPTEVERISGESPVLYLVSPAAGPSYRLVSIDHGSILQDRTLEESELREAVKQSALELSADSPLPVILLHRPGVKVSDVTRVLALLAQEGISLALAEEEKAKLAKRPVMIGVLGLRRELTFDETEPAPTRTGSVFDSALAPPPSAEGGNVRVGALDVRGPLDDVKARRVIASNSKKFSACLDIARNRSPNLSGTVRVEVDVAKDGTVLGAKNDGSKVSDRELVACVVSIFYGLKFAAAASDPSTMDVEIVFSPPR